MALALEADDVGLYAVMECDALGCERHVAVRPAALPVNPLELVETCRDWSLEEGWLLAGFAWCPDHRGPWDARADGTVGEGQSWVPVTSAIVNRAQRPS